MDDSNRLRIVCILFLVASLSCMFFSCASTNTNELKREALRRYPVEKPFPESEFIYIDGARLHIRQWDPVLNGAEKPKGIVFLIHGVSGSTYNWRFLAPALASDGWKVLTADLPPFGFSGEKQSSGFSLDPLPEDSASRAILLWDLFDSMYGDYSGSLIIVGHSLGGRIASIMTLSKPEKVTKLVLLAPAVYGSSAIPTITKYWPFKQVVVPGAKKGLGNIDIVRIVVNKAYGKHVNNEDLVGNWAPFLRDGVPEACAEWTIKSIDTVAPPVQNIQAPTLILWSKKDSIVPNKGVSLENQIKGSKYIEIPGGSHCIMDTDSKLVESSIIGFIN